jgi:hypothetical protein
METVGLLVLVALSLVAGFGLAVSYGLHTSEREQVLRLQLEALRAVNRLSVAAWQARKAMREEVERQAGRG